MLEVVKFKAFCIERYKFHHKMSGKDVIWLFNKYGVLDYLGSFYDDLHCYGENYILSDIDDFISNRM